MIPLTAYYKEALQKNNIVPLNEEVWEAQPANPEGYFLCGIPVDQTRIESDGITMSPRYLKVEKLETLPQEVKDLGRPKPDLFYGRIYLDEDLTTIKGMSGGPILALQVDDAGNQRYWVSAVQSTWFEKYRIIEACPTKLLGRALENLMSQATPDSDEI